MRPSRSGFFGDIDPLRDLRYIPSGCDMQSAICPFGTRTGSISYRIRQSRISHSETNISRRACAAFRLGVSRAESYYALQLFDDISPGDVIYGLRRMIYSRRAPPPSIIHCAKLKTPMAFSARAYIPPPPVLSGSRRGRNTPCRASRSACTAALPSDRGSCAGKGSAAP